MAVIPSPLSNSIQGINESTVSGSVFGGNKLDPETKSTLQSLSSSVTSLQSQVNELGKNNITNSKVFANLQESFAAQINSVSLQLNGVNKTLESIAIITASESAIEKQKNLYEQEKDRRLAEAGARGGKENLLETKIQSALSEPVKRIGSKISFGFDNLMSVIWTLLGGWLTTQIIRALKALQDGDTKKLNEIKDSIIKTLLVAGGVFTIINIGIVKVISTITGLVGKIGKFLIGGLIIKPFQMVATALRGTLPGRTPPPPSPGNNGPKPAVGKFNVIGGIISVVSGGLNFLNGENVDAALNALTILPAGGRFGTGLRVAAGTMVALDEIAEFLGGNLTGADPKLLKEKRKDLEDVKNKDKDKLKASPLKKSEPPKPEAAKPAPTTSMIPPANNLRINAPDTSTPDTSTPDTSKPAIPPPDAERVKQFEQAWKMRDFGPARGRIEGAWNKMSPEEKQQAKDWAGSTGKNWKEMRLPDTTQTSAVPPKETPKSAETSSKPPTSPTTTPAETSSKPSTAEITPAQTTKMQTVPFNIGPEPEPKPNVVYAPSGPSTPQQQQPMTTGTASDVPFIPSSNSDNFYSLYSQINYNVVL
jgi:hypothetical protein